MEVNEEIVINEDGSGTYLTKMDMGQLLEMMQSFAGEEELTKEGLDRAIDTTIQMKDILDSAKDLSAEQKALMARGTMKMQMDIKKKLFKIDLLFPYTGYSSLQKLMEGQGNSGAGITGAFKGLMGGSNQPPRDTTKIIDEAREPDMQDVSGIYEVTIKNGLISRKTNEAKYKAPHGKARNGADEETAKLGHGDSVYHYDQVAPAGKEGRQCDYQTLRG